jgi:hypothetical protein
MENEKSLVRTSDVRLPKFVEDAYDSIEGMKQFANMLLESKLVPDSYYEKGPDNKPDYTKGKTSAVVIVLLQAQQLAVPPMTGLQHIVPVNGLLSIKGDLAKTMIFASGKLKKDSWVETVTGTIEDENMVVTITATRDDNGITTSRSFSVDKAKRMGLWITSTQANSADGWKFKKSAWFKTPDRMLFYRCLGNLARDLFSDVLLNMYTTEEAVDIQRETTEVIETESGAKITIPDKEHAKGRSAKMTDRVSDKIPDNKFGEVKKDNIQDATIIEETTHVDRTANPEDESPFISDRGSVEYMDGKEVIRENTDNTEVKEELIPGAWTLKQMEEMDTPILLKIVMEDMDMMEASEIIGGKNTNKKLRELIFAHQNNRLDAHVAPYLKKEPIVTGDGCGNNMEADVIEADVSRGEIPVNKGFDKQTSTEQIDAFLDAPVKKEETGSNKYGLTISPFNKGEGRDFAETKNLFNLLAGVTPGINANRYLELAGKKGILAAFPDKEIFCKNATVKMVNELLDSN